MINTADQGGKGTGLGLALVRHVMKLSGGRLGYVLLSQFLSRNTYYTSVLSQLNVGSTF